MDSFEVNKFFGALTGALMVYFAISFGTEALFAEHEGGHEGEAKLAFAVPIEAPVETPGKSGGAAASEPSLGQLMASADPTAGERVFKKCGACHTSGKGDGNKIGPALYGVLGRDVGSEAGFSYSDGMLAKEGSWTFEALNAFLTSPKEVVPGTKMTFAGLSSAEDRANVMAYLNQHSDSPLPLPAAQAQAAQPAAQPAAAAEAPAAPAAASGGSDIAARLASADPAAGERVFRKCKACHNAGAGEANKIGPLLYGVVGRKVGAEAGFSYSSAMAEHGGTWTWEALDAFLTSPKEDVPGTKMTFAGLSDPQDRANVLAYLNQQSASPLPKP